MLPPLRRRQRTIVALDGAIQLRLAASPDPSGERVLEDFAARHLARQPLDLPEQRPVDDWYDDLSDHSSDDKPSCNTAALGQREGVGTQRFSFTELVPA